VSVPGRLLGFDFGTVRVGLAVSDPERKIAVPLATYQRRRRELDAAYFRQLARDEQVTALVVGLPVHMSGQEGQKAAEARAFGTWLAELTGLPVFYWDERYSTAQAEGYLLSAGLTNKKRKERRDRVAAQILLQSYLDSGCPVADVPAALESERAPAEELSREPSRQDLDPT
jgi:putative holliday junction resolvase